MGILKEIRRVSDPDKAQIIWDGIKVMINSWTTQESQIFSIFVLRLLLLSHAWISGSICSTRPHVWPFLSLLAEYSFSDCARPEADPGPASAVAVHEQELQAGQGHHPAPARPCCGGQPCEAAQEGGQEGVGITVDFG